MTTRREVTAGTASAGYLAPRTPCTAWTPQPADPGERVRCSSCGRERHHHIPTPRKATA